MYRSSFCGGERKEIEGKRESGKPQTWIPQEYTRGNTEFPSEEGETNRGCRFSFSSE